MPLIVGSSPLLGCAQFRKHSGAATRGPSILARARISASFSPICSDASRWRMLPVACSSSSASPSSSSNTDDSTPSSAPQAWFPKLSATTQHHSKNLTSRWMRFCRRTLGWVAFMLFAMMAIGSRPAWAKPRVAEAPTTSTAASWGSSESAPKPLLSTQPISEEPYSWADESRPELTSGVAKTSRKGYVPVGYDELMGSTVYDPADVPVRNNKGETAEQINAIMEQYDMDDFALGIKQFMIEQKIQQELEDGIDKGGGNKDLEEKLAEALFAGEDNEPRQVIRTEDVVDDAFTTEVAEEYLTVHGEVGSLETAWRVQQTLTELSYTQFWTLVAEGHILKARFYGPEQVALMAYTAPSCPGGKRMCKVVVPPDPMIVAHLEHHDVEVDYGPPVKEGVYRALTAQMIRYTFPFMFIGAVFWLLHTWLLDPMPNLKARDEMLRYRRELMHLTSQLSLRSPARQVKIDSTSDDFIPWDEIHGIDEVKKEIMEIIDYLKNPQLLRLRGVARIGGVLLAGSPGTGKTLLAKSIAAESGVKMFTCSGTDFFDIYNGVGARRIRETFEKMRNNAPAILFIDEFDALGAARGNQSGSDEAGSMVNELMIQMDGAQDNSGLVILGATNRPGVIDNALVRPGRFDRVVYMPLPDADGRAKILQVHARNKAVDKDINWYQVSRAMAGFTGADCMGLMQRAARMTARDGRDSMKEDDIYSAMENKALESTSERGEEPKPGESDGFPDNIPVNMKKSIAVYEAGKALLAYITPGYDEVMRVSVCPFDLLTGYVLFADDEGRDPDRTLTRADVEMHIVVNLAGRCAEKLVMGESEMTGLGSPDFHQANMLAREMILSMGMGRRTGLNTFMDVVPDKESKGLLLRTPDSATQSTYYHKTGDMSDEQSRLALAEVVEILEAAEAKAMYGLAINWKPLQAFVEALLEKGVLQGDEIEVLLEQNQVIHFMDGESDEFGFEEDGSLKYPFKPKRDESMKNSSTGRGDVAPSKDKVWLPIEEDGKVAGMKHGWHWNMPYSIKKDYPDWYKKEMERYNY